MLNNNPKFTNGRLKSNYSKDVAKNGTKKQIEKKESFLRKK